MKLFYYTSAILLLASCTAEQNYRGVPEPTWRQLSGEQKQLIIDRSFADDTKDE